MITELQGHSILLTREAIYKEDMIVDLTREDVKAYIQEVCEDGLLNENETNENLLADIKKYGLISV